MDASTAHAATADRRAETEAEARALHAIEVLFAPPPRVSVQMGERLAYGPPLWSVSD